MNGIIINKSMEKSATCIWSLSLRTISLTKIVPIFLLIPICNFILFYFFGSSTMCCMQYSYLIIPWKKKKLRGNGEVEESPLCIVACCFCSCNISFCSGSVRFEKEKEMWLINIVCSPCSRLIILSFSQVLLA